MKNRILWAWSMGLALALSFVSGCVQEASSSTENNAAAIKAETDSAVTVQSAAATGELAPEETPEGDISDGAVRPISTDKTPPANVKVTGPVSEIVKLADSGVEESVMLAFVNKSTSTFNLRSDEIIYLKDIGVPNSVVTAMIQRDETLKEGSAATALTEQSPAITAEPQPPPQADYATEPYVPSVSAPLVEPTYSNFYDSLSPYGSWVEVDGYGRCWQPTTVVVNSGWRPYFDGGRWVYTDCGWYWHSDYSWGWAPFHYGRWFRHQRIGWCWTPDTVWGPSWVSWRYNNDYCGWAPLPPGAHFRPGVGFAFHGRGDFGLGADCFAFIPFSHFRDRHLRQHALAQDQVSRIFNQTVVSTRILAHNNRVINHGIAREQVAAATRTEVSRVTLHETGVGGGRGISGGRLERNGSTLSVLRPPSTQAAGSRPARGGRVGPDNHSDSGSTETTAASSPPHAGRGIHAVSQSTRTETGRATGADTRSRHPASGVRSSSAAATAAVTLGRGNSAEGAPLVFRGQDRAARVEGRNSDSGPRAPASQNSVIVIGRKDAATGRSLPPQRSNEHDSGRLSANQNSQQVAAMAPQARAVFPSPWAAPRASDPSERPDRSQPEYRQQAPAFSSGFENRSSARATIPQPQPQLSRHSAPAYESSAQSARAETPRYNPGPSSAPQPARSAPAMESRGHSSPPSAPPSSSSSSHSRSSDRNSR